MRAHPTPAPGSPICFIYFNEYFGFTENEVKKLLEDARILKQYPVIKEWYDGYNFWSILYRTGYLTSEDTERISSGKVTLRIPNKEIKKIFKDTVQEWFKDTVHALNRKKLFDAVWKGETETITEQITKILVRTISYYDYREDFYHAFLAGIFTGAGYRVESNKEHGEGRSDIVVKDNRNFRIAVFEMKYSNRKAELEKDCEKAIAQIADRNTNLCLAGFFYKNYK